MGPERRQPAQRAFVAPCRQQRLDVLAQAFQLGGEPALGGVLQQRSIDPGRHVLLRLAQDVGDALVRGREAGGVGQREEIHQRPQAGVEIQRRGRAPGEDGVEHLGGDAPLALHVVRAQALHDVFVDLGGRGVGAGERRKAAGRHHRVAVLRRRALGRHRLHVGPYRDERGVDQGLQVEVDALLDDGAQHAERRAPEAEGVLGAGWLLAGGEDADDGVQLVRDRHRRAGARFGQLVARESRPVLFLEGGRDLEMLPVMGRVIAPHEPLQLRKFADHGRHQVAF